MGNNNYARGAAFERKVCEWLRGLGYIAVRAAGSHGLTDVLAVSEDGTATFIQCKTGKARMSGPDKERLIREARTHKSNAAIATPGVVDPDLDYIYLKGDN